MPSLLLTTIFILAVSSAVRLYDVSARAGDVSMGISAEFCYCQSKNRAQLDCVNV